MVDEPELNLHPENQRRLARFIATLVNNGIKVFVTTHSDYIIKEINTLIMFDQEKPHFSEIRKKFKEYLPEDKLAYSRVALYMTGIEKILKSGNKKKTKSKTLVRANVNSVVGIEAKSFDITINEMNTLQEALYYEQ